LLTLYGQYFVPLLLYFSDCTVTLFFIFKINTENFGCCASSHVSHSFFM